MTYKVTGELGRGGMGTVYRARHVELERDVAIKLVGGNGPRNDLTDERFLREMAVLQELAHPGIVRFLDSGIARDQPYLVMELLEGQTLKDVIDHRTMQLDEILCCAREVAEALGAAHAKGVIHRDIKPANIFLVDKPNGGVQAKVLDFGLAKFQGGVLGARTNRSLDLTAAGATVGTLAYMSPEQARGEVLDSRSDLFSLGVVMYEMSTRHIPFPGATSALVFVQLLNHQPESVRNWNEGIPRELDRIIFKLMAKERTQRYQTAQELDEALAKVGDKGGGWLRKATSAVPLVRTADPVAREKRTGRRSSDSQLDMSRMGPTPTPPVASPRGSGGEDQVLRPVARMPRVGASPSPAADLPAVAAAANAQFPPRNASPVALESMDIQPIAPSDTHLDSAGFAAAVTSPFEERPSRIKRRVVTPLRVGFALAALVLIGVAIYLFKVGRLRPAILTDQDRVVLTEIENRTGDKALDGVVVSGLQIALSESPYLRLSPATSYLTARGQVAPDAGDSPGQVVARNTAEKLQTKAYIFGQITGTAPPYLIHLDVLNTTSNDTLASVDQQVPSLQQVPGVIDHLATSLRSSIGEPGESIAKFGSPLAQEATTNLDALHALSEGDAAYAAGKSLDALRFFQEAVTLEPKFVQAQLRLAVLYRKERAELAAGEAAKAALSAADNASARIRTIAQYEYEMNASGDYARAAAILRELVTKNPHDADALERLARCLRLEGRVAEALQAAQQAYAEDPFNVDAYVQAENSLIGLDRFAAAAQMDAQVQKFGPGHVGGALTAAYLENRPDDVATAVATLEASTGGFRTDWNLGIYLDNVGHLKAGGELWRSRAASAMEVHGLESAAGFLLSQGAMDRALIGDCADGLAMAREADGRPEGITALFNVGMASALCGDLTRAQKVSDDLQRLYPQSFAVKGFYVADIMAGIALHNQDPTAALELLKSARQFDLISLTPVLRGRAHVALRQVQIGIVDFQTVLTHRGVPFIVGNVSYPVAQLGVARAFADTGDVGNSAEAYRHFLELWKTADANQPLVNEAKAHTK